MKPHNSPPEADNTALLLEILEKLDRLLPGKVESRGVNERDAMPEVLTLARAACIAGITPNGMLRRAAKYKLGEKVGTSQVVYKSLLLKWMDSRGHIPNF